MKKNASLIAVLALSACGPPLPPPKHCDDSGHACTWAGIPGAVGFNGDGLDRLSTKLYWAMDMLFSKDGTPWLIDWNNHLVRTVEPDGTIKTRVGWTDPVFPGDGAPTEASGAVGTEVQLNHPTDLAQLSDGTVLIMAWHNHKLRKVDAAGRVSIVAGAGAGYFGDGVPARGALFKQPKALVVDAQDNMYILDQQNFRVRKLSAAGVITTIAGNGMQASTGDGGPALMASLNFEAGSNPEPSGGLALKDGKLYIAETETHRLRVMDLTTNVISAFAGTGTQGFSGDDGPALQAQFFHPRDLEFGPDGRLYVADTDNSRVRAIDLATGVVTTVVGTSEAGLDAKDDLLATHTKLKRPFGIEFDGQGNLFVSDTINSRILRVAK